MTNVNAQLRLRRILVLCPFPVGVAAGQRLKYEQHFHDWQTAGYDIEVSSFMDDAMWRIVYKNGHYLKKAFGVLRGQLRRIRDLTRISHYDVVYVFMWVTPFGTSFFERATRRLANKLIFDIEDNVLIGQSSQFSYNPNAFVQFIKGPWKARYLIETADHVVSASPFLNKKYLEINKRRKCSYVPPSIDTDRFIPASNTAVDHTITIGWTGTFSTRIYLDLLRDVFQRLAKKHRFKLKVIGNFDYELDGVDLEVVRWTSEREVEDLQGIDIGVYPLSNDEWMLGKAGLKAIQYMAVGLPTVATNIGTTPMIITNDVNGLLVETDDEWFDALERLLNDPALRRRLGASARQCVVENYSTKVIAGRYRRILDDVGGNQHAVEKV